MLEQNLKYKMKRNSFSKKCYFLFTGDADHG